jgi:hypothetical protein
MMHEARALRLADHEVLKVNIAGPAQGEINHARGNSVVC